MNHADHDHSHSHGDPSAVRNIRFVFFLNLTFTIIELIGGAFTNSVAVISDAIHDLSDTISLGISWYMEGISQRKRDVSFTFGYRRFSLVAALLSGLVLVIGSTFVFVEAIPRLFYPEQIDVSNVIWLALLGIVVNGFAAFRLRRGRTLNENMLALHQIEDVLGWSAVLIIAIAMKLGDFLWLDPLLSIAIACWMSLNAFRRLKKILLIFMQSMPDDVDILAVERLLQSFPPVLGAHDTHVWSLDGTHHVLSTHLVLEQTLAEQELVDLKARIRKALELHDIDHATLETELQGEKCQLENCK